MSGIDANTVLCLHADGADASTSFPDSSLYTHTVTANGDAQVDTAQSVFGGASVLFDGNDYLSSLDSADWNLGSGDFTLDWRVRFTDLTGFPCMIGQWSPTPSWEVLYTSNVLRLNYSTDGVGSALIDNAWSPSTDTWYHVAVVRTGNVLKMFVDGSQIGSDAAFNLTLFDSTSGLAIGSRAGSFGVIGWMDEVRVSKGVARWTANFTPPTAAYSVDDLQPVGLLTMAGGGIF